MSSSSIGPPASGGTPMQTGLVENRRAMPPNGATSSPARALTKWMRDQPGLGRPLAPVADPAEMGGVAQPDHRHARRLRLGDADIDRLRPDGLAEPVVAVEHRVGGAFASPR